MYELRQGLLTQNEADAVCNYEVRPLTKRAVAKQSQSRRNRLNDLPPADRARSKRRSVLAEVIVRAMKARTKPLPRLGQRRQDTQL